MDVTLLDDFRELSLDRPTNTPKPLEELERLTVDEDLDPVERAVYLLSSGQEIQRISVVNGLSDLLKEHNAESLRRVVPKVREVLHVAQAEMQLAACAAFLQVLQRQLVPVQNYTQTFLQSILVGIDSREPDVAAAWLETLLEVIELLPKDVIKKDIMSMAIAKGQLAQPVQSRLFCCQILGKTATKFEPFVIRKDILPIVQSLCQDIDYEVRGCMCRQLDPVARGLGLDSTKSAILPELVELTNDEESFVRIAGIETVASMLSLLDEDTRSTTIVPLVCKFCQQALDSNDVTLPVVAKLIGKICHELSILLSEDKRRFFIDWYKQVCLIGETVEKPKTREGELISRPTIASIPMFAVDFFEEPDPSTECRKNAAFNLPAMVLFVGIRLFKSELHLTVKAMCADSSSQVRKAIAAGFHEILTILGSTASLLLPEFMQLLKDDCTDVLQGLVENLDQTLHMFSNYCAARPSVVSTTKGSMPRPTPLSMVELTPAIIACEDRIAGTNNWRLQELLFSKLQCLPDCYSSDHIHTKYFPLLFHKLDVARALPVRRMVLRTLLTCMRRNTRLDHRTDVINRLINDFAHSRSCHKRSLFIDACEMMIELFSHSYFKTTLFDHLVALSKDDVANIRLRLCPMLPILKGLINFPSDRTLLQSLEQCVRRILVNERDRDVIIAIEKAVHDLDRVYVRMETELSRKRGPTFDDEDTEDKKKEAEEHNLLTLEEQDRRDEEGRGKLEKKTQKGRHDISSRIPGPRTGLPKLGGATTSAGGTGSSTGTSGATRGTGISKVLGNKPPRKGSMAKGFNNSASGSPSPGCRSSQSSASSTSSRKSSAGSVASSTTNNRRMSTGGSNEVIGRSRRS